MRRFKLAGAPIRNARTRIAGYRPEPQLPPEIQERKDLYASRRWKTTRAKVLRENKRCASCGTRNATTIDHLLGHLDDQAAAVACSLSISAPEHWRDRFFSGPFIAVCASCHSKKTKAERAGKLSAWIEYYRARRHARQR